MASPISSNGPLVAINVTANGDKTVGEGGQSSAKAGGNPQDRAMAAFEEASALRTEYEKKRAEYEAAVAQAPQSQDSFAPAAPAQEQAPVTVGPEQAQQQQPNPFAPGQFPAPPQVQQQGASDPFAQAYPQAQQQVDPAYLQQLAQEQANQQLLGQQQIDPSQLAALQAQQQQQQAGFFPQGQPTA